MSRFQDFKHSLKKRRKADEMNRGELREAQTRGHRFLPERFCPKCQTMAHDPKNARQLK